MRRMILTSLVLLPVLARAQASTATEPKPSTSSANLRAELTPAGAAVYAMAGAAPAAAPTAVLPTTAIAHAAFREIVHTQMTDDFADAALRQGGTLQYVMYGGGTPTEATAPVLTRAVEIDLSQPELAAEPAVTNVIVRATVDAYGFPRDLTVAQSAGASLNKKALATVSQFRFKPATQDNRPVDAAVLITIKIQKP
jgi:TonB family protein